MKSRFQTLLSTLAFSSLLGLAAASHAVVEGYKYQFDDPEKLEQFQQLTADLRCPKCQNQDLADSNSPVASDMRSKIYELMQEGKTSEEVVDYMVARYGDFVRYKPELRNDTAVLWFAPAALLLIGLLVLPMIRRSGKIVAPLTDEEKARLQALRASQTADYKEPRS